MDGVVDIDSMQGWLMKEKSKSSRWVVCLVLALHAF